MCGIAGIARTGGAPVDIAVLERMRDAMTHRGPDDSGLYVDDNVLNASSSELLQRTTTALQHQFAMKDLSPLHHFLDVSVEQRSNDLFLQRQYAWDILERAGMSNCKPCSTPVDT